MTQQAPCTVRCHGAAHPACVPVSVPTHPHADVTPAAHRPQALRCRRLHLHLASDTMNGTSSSRGDCCATRLRACRSHNTQHPHRPTTAGAVSAVSRVPASWQRVRRAGRRRPLAWRAAALPAASARPAPNAAPITLRLPACHAAACHPAACRPTAPTACPPLEFR